MGKNAGNAVAGGCTGCILGAVVCGLLGAGIGVFLDEQAAARPQKQGLEGLLDLRLRLAAPCLGSCGAIVGAILGSIVGSAVAVSERRNRRPALPATIATLGGAGANADDEKKRTVASSSQSQPEPSTCGPRGITRRGTAATSQAG